MRRCRVQIRESLERLCFGARRCAVAAALLATLDAGAAIAPAGAHGATSADAAATMRYATSAHDDDLFDASAWSASVSPAPTMASTMPSTVSWQEYSVGADVSRDSWLVYSNATLAPFGSLWSDGARIRISGAYGRYDYVGQRGKAALAIPFSGRVTVLDGLVGYQMRFGPLTAKAFAGVSAITHDIAPDDALASIGQKIGAKGVIELWLDISRSAWSSLDLGFASAHHTYAARSRTGYRIWPALSVGFEAGLNGSEGVNDDGSRTELFDPLHRNVRLGGFGRYEWSGGELSFSGGLSTDLRDRRDPYGTANIMLQF